MSSYLLDLRLIAWHLARVRGRESVVRNVFAHLERWIGFFFLPIVWHSEEESSVVAVQFCAYLGFVSNDC